MDGFPMVPHDTRNRIKAYFPIFFSVYSLSSAKGFGKQHNEIASVVKWLIHQGMR